MRIEVYQGADGWSWRLLDTQGTVILDSPTEIQTASGQTLRLPRVFGTREECLNVATGLCPDAGVPVG